MSDDESVKITAFLEQHPDIEIFELVLPDMCGGLRGKWVSRDKIHKAFSGGLKMPLSSVAFDVWGRDGEAWVFESGDGDGICRADIRTLTPVPWLDRPTGQVLLSLEEVGGAPLEFDVREILRRLMARFAELGLTPVLASEMEFYLLQEGDDAQGRPLHTQTDAIGGALQSGQTYSIELMEQMSELMHGIRDAGVAQGLPIDTLIKESAPSQYEINLYHNADAQVAADHAQMIASETTGTLLANSRSGRKFWASLAVRSP